MDVLIVGPGAVGQPYAHHLARGGATVSALVRPHRRAEAEAGYRLSRMRLLGRAVPGELRFAAVYDESSAIAERRFDQIWLCTPTDALPSLLGELPGVAGDAAIVCLQPGVDVRPRVRDAFGDRPLVFGAIGVVSFPAPLPGATRGPPGPGLAYLFPPGSPTELSGDRSSVDAAVAVLRAGGCPARAVADARRSLSFTSGIIQPLVAGLELEGWSLRALRRSDTMKRVADAAREAVAIGAAELGHPPPPPSKLVSALSLRLVLGVARALLPFDFEAYLRFHFTKVGAQTRRNLDAYTEAAEHHGLPAAALRDLRRRLDAD